MKLQVFRRESCRLCSGIQLETALRLVPTPPANAFVPAGLLDKSQDVFPLELFFCRSCKHLQMLDVVDPALLFENYVYVSGTSPVFVRHFEQYAQEVRSLIGARQGGLIVDIGSNDGTLLKCFKKLGFQNILGIDPAKDIARKANEEGVETLSEFFTPDLAANIRKDRGPATVVTANNVFAHCDDLAGFIDGVRTLLAPDGVFVFEVSYLCDVVEKTLFDTIYHEHLAYHSVMPLVRFFFAHGMELIEAIRTDSHGGSLRGIAQIQGGVRVPGESVPRAVAVERQMGLDLLETYHQFSERISALKDQLGSQLRLLKAQGKNIAGYGAPAKATTLMYHFELGPEIIDYIVDDNPMKQDMYSPGMHIPVVGSDVIFQNPPDFLIILAWNFAGSIMEKLTEYKHQGGKFIVPLPTLEIF